MPATPLTTDDVLPPFQDRAAAIAATVASTVKSIVVKSGDLLLEYVRDTSGTALSTADGAKWSPADDVYAEHFGATGDGDEAKATANINAFDAAIAFVNTRLGGEVNFVGRHTINRPLVITQPRVFLRGLGSGTGAGRSDIRAIHQYGPVIRWKGDYPGGSDFLVSTNTTRRTATRVTKSNYAALGLTRDDMNPGIWLEPDDSASNPAMDKPFFSRVWSHNQPSDGWVCVTRCYSGVWQNCGASQPNGHGIVFSSGEYTARTNLFPVGVLSLNEWSTFNAKGHGICAGTPDDTYAVGQLRILIHSCDNFNNAGDSVVRFVPYELYMKADDSRVEYSALGGGAGVGAAYIGGKRARLENNRLLNLGSGQAPIYVMAETIPGRKSDGILINRSHVNSGSFTELVEVEVGAGRVEVFQPVLDGTFSGLSTGAAMTERGNVRKWDGSLQIPQMLVETQLLVGKSISDDTSAGSRLVSDASGALLSVARSNVPVILNRLSTDGPIQFNRRDNVEVSSHIVHGTTQVGTSAATVFSLSTRSGGTVVVTGTLDAGGGIIRRFYDLVFFAFGIAPIVIGTREEGSPAARTYGVLSNSHLRLAIASGTYNVRAAGTVVSAAE